MWKTAVFHATETFKLDDSLFVDIHDTNRKHPDAGAGGGRTKL